MTRLEEKLYFQSVFDAIDQVYQMKKSQQISSSYEERLRASFNKLIVPDWYNHQYTSINGLRKTKSHGHVPRLKRTKNTNDTPNTSISSSNGTHSHSYNHHHHHRSPSRSWSERPPIRHDSTTSSYDTNGSIINGRRSTTSNGSSSSSSYAPGVQRVAQSSTWYKPRTFTTKFTNGHSYQPPKPLPRYSKIDQEQQLPSRDSSLSKIEHVRYPIKPRTMAQAQIPPEESLVDISSDADVTLIPNSPSTFVDNLPNLPRTNSLRSVSSEAESYRSAVLPSGEKNLQGTDSSSYASVNERCLSPSTASYHTAMADDTSSSITGYETPTPQLDEDNQTLSSHSSLSDLSHAETLEPTTEDLDIAVISTAEQKNLIIPSMANSTTPSNNTQSIENTNWYEGSLETCIHPNGSIQNQLREIPNENILHEVDINAVGDEFFLFSPRDSTDDEPSSKELTESSKRIFNMEDKQQQQQQLSDPLDFDNQTSSMMITNLDDILIDDDDDDENYSFDRFSNGNYRRPIQEDILYEVEHENSFSDHSQNTSSIIVTDDQTSIKFDANIDYLTSTNSPIKDNEKQTSLPTTTTANDNNNILPIYILPPLFTTSPTPAPSSSLHIDTNNNFQKWDSFIHQFPDYASPTSYTSQIRHRHYSVGSYYDNKTTTVTVYPNQTYYYLGSAPVSPLSRVSTTDNDSHYHPYHSPMIYDNVSLNALRRVNPFLESNHTYANFDSRQTTNYRSSSVNPEERTRVITYTSPKITSKSVERTIPENPTAVIPQTIISSPSTRTSFVTFPQYEIPPVRPKPFPEIPTTTYHPPPISSLNEEKSPTLPPRFAQIEQTSPPPPLPTQNIYQEIDSLSTDDDQFPTPNADLQFIRGAIERVFHFHGGSTTDTTSESSTHYEEVDEQNRKQYPAIEAVQRFYHHKNLSDDVETPLENGEKSHSSTSKKTPSIIARKTTTPTKSSEHSSEEIDDTLNDIEEVDSHDEKLKRRVLTNQTPQTSTDNSPDSQSKLKKKTSQETQTIGRPKPSIQITRSTVPPIDIVTEMIIEQEEDDHTPIDDVDGDMVIFYDDIEIVEHSIGSCSSESDSASSSSHHYSKPVNTSINQQPPPPPPVPARTLKPSHLLNNEQQSPSKTNKTYELQRDSIRKKFDVNSVNDMFNRAEPSITHRLPSARHFVGKLNTDDSPVPPTTTTNGHRPTPVRSAPPILPVRSLIADTTALVKHIQNSLSRNSLHDTQINSNPLSTSNKDLRAFVSATYSPSEQNTIDDNGTVHARHLNNTSEDQTFKRQARLSRSFQNVSEYKTTDQYPKKETQTQPSKSVENNLDQISPIQPKSSLNLTSLVSSTSFSALPNSDENARMLSMKWYTGQVSENSEICYNAHHIPPDDLLHGYISAHSNRDTQELLARLQRSNDARIHAALDDIRSRVTQFDASKTQGDLQVFMRYLESRLRDLNNKNSPKKSTSNGLQQADENNKDNAPTRQLGRQQLRSSGSSTEGTNGHQPTPPRRSSQSSANQENPAVFDDMLNTVLGLPKKGVSALPQTFPSKREKSTPLVPTQITTNTTTEREVGKRLFESGTYKDPRLIYDGPKKKEKEEQPLETSV